jgi:transketolase
MANKIATRDAYGKALVALADKYPNVVVLDADLAGSTRTEWFAAEHPDRFFDMGIAEANMMGYASGLAACGKVVFASGFSIFTTGRAWEQIRDSLAYSNLNVTVVGTHAGLSVGEDGATHQSLEDIAIMRVIPNMIVVCPCDANETTRAVEALIEYEGPAYLRLGRAGVETVTDSLPNYEFHLGKGTLLNDGTDVTICATGLTVQMSLEAVKLLAAEGISARLIDIHTIKPLDEDILLKAAKETGAIVTTEEHSVIGGLGSAVSEYLSGVCPVPVVRHGVDDVFGKSGEAGAVLKYFDITPEKIAESAKKAISLKK